MSTPSVNVDHLREWVGKSETREGLCTWCQNEAIANAFVCDSARRV